MNLAIQKPLFTNEEGQICIDQAQKPTPKITTGQANSAFEAWLTGHVPPLRSSTIKVYRALWDKFLRFQELNKSAWDDTRPETIKAFLASLIDSKRQHRERYQLVLERAFADIDLFRQSLALNPAAKDLVAVPKGREWRDALDNDPTQFLTSLEQHVLREAIVNISAKIERVAMAQSIRWRLSRDTAIVTMLFACGVKPAEVTVFSVDCIERQGKDATLNAGAYHGLSPNERANHIDPNRDATHAFIGEGMGAQRLLPIPDWAVPILEQWLAIRESEPSGSPTMQIQRLFPGNREITQHRQSTVMNPATLFRLVSNWGKKHAGLTLNPQRLRNTYGASLFAAGKEIPEVDQLMGYAPGAASAFRLRQSWVAWCEAHNESPNSSSELSHVQDSKAKPWLSS